MEAILEDCLACLHQGDRLLVTLTQEDFTARDAELRGGSIGAHFRHNIDHFSCFLEGLEAGQINYDARQRNAQIETDPEACRAALNVLIEALPKLADRLDTSIQVRMDSGSDQATATASSTLRRELQFLISHSIHHYALIALLCRSRQVPIEPSFGVAPSTLRHEQSLSLTAQPS